MKVKWRVTYEAVYRDGKITDDSVTVSARTAYGALQRLLRLQPWFSNGELRMTAVKISKVE